MNAFPVRYSSDPVTKQEIPPSTGMDLRDYFAAAIMQGLMASQWQTTEPYAEYVYKVADAMMKAREQ